MGIIHFLGRAAQRGGPSSFGVVPVREDVDVGGVAQEGAPVLEMDAVLVH